jgi:hypothetical protein
MLHLIGEGTLELSWFLWPALLMEAAVACTKSGSSFR